LTICLDAASTAAARTAREGFIKVARAPLMSFGVPRRADDAAPKDVWRQGEPAASGALIGAPGRTVNASGRLPQGFGALLISEMAPARCLTFLLPGEIR
jgi:hypothetical protein